MRKSLRHAFDGVAATDILWFPKCIFFVSTASKMPWSKFSTQFFIAQGLTGAQLGLLRSAGLIIKSVSFPLWGVVADVTGRVRDTLLLSLLLSTGLLFLAFDRGWALGSFPLLFVAKVTRSALNGTWPLVEVLVLQALAKSGAAYGPQRLWCAIAWGSVTVAAGWCIDRYGLHTMFSLTYALVSAQVILLLYGMPAATSQHRMRPKQGQTLRRLCDVLRERRVQVFYLQVFVYSIIMAIPEQVLFISLETEFHASRSLAGAAIGVSVLLELPVMLFSRQLLQRFGRGRLTLAAHVTCLLRLLAYPVVGHVLPVWTVLVVQLSHGLCFALMWIAAVDYAQNALPEAVKSSSLSFLGSTWGVLGQGVGALIWGYLFDEHGSVMVYWTGACAQMLLIAVLTLFGCYGSMDSKPSPSPPSSPTLEGVHLDSSPSS